MFNFNKVYQLNKILFQQYSLLEAALPDSKDIKRIQDIITKSVGSPIKGKQLATRMCDAIKDKAKMERRYAAAVTVCGEQHPITLIFKAGCARMGILVDEPAQLEQEAVEQAVDLDNEEPADILPEPDKVEEISPAAINKAIRKLPSETDKKLKELKIFQETDGDLYDLPFEYINKMEEYRTFLLNEISKTNILSTLLKTIQDGIGRQSRYRVSNFRIMKFVLSRGIIQISAYVYYVVYLGGVKHTYSISIQDARYNFIEDTWDVKKAVRDLISNSYSRSWENARYVLPPNEPAPEEKIAGFLKSLGVIIKNALKENKTAKKFMLAYNSYIQALHNQSLDVEDHMSVGAHVSNNKFNRLKERILSLICDKYNVDIEPDQGWPGMKIVNIDKGYIIFTMWAGPIAIGSFWEKNDDKKAFVNNLSGLTHTDEICTLYNFFTETVGISRDYISKPDLHQSHLSPSYLLIDIRELAAALNN